MSKDLKTKVAKVSLSILVAGTFYTSIVLAAVPPPRPTLNFKVGYDLTSITIPYNTSTILTWSSTETQFCTAHGAWSGYKSVTAGTHTYPTGNLLTSKVYTLACTGNDNSVIQRSVTVNILQPTLNFTAGSGNLASIVIPYNTGITLNWIATDATECNATLGSNNWPGLKNLSGSFFTGNLTAVNVYTLTCTNPAGSVEKYVTVSAPQPGHTSANCGWRVASLSPQTYEAACGDFGGRGNDPEPYTNSACINGATDPPQCTTGASCTLLNDGSDYTQILCSGSQYSETYWKCTCAPPFTNDSIGFNASPTTVEYGSSSTLTWSAPGATSCTGSGSNIPYTWPGYKNHSGTFSTGSLTSAQTYNLSCTSLTGSGFKSATVAVKPKESVYTQQSGLFVRTDGANDVTYTTATLHGTGGDTGPNPSDMTAYFRYSKAPISPIYCNDIYGTNMVATSDLKLGSSSIKSFSQPIIGLAPDTTYYYCAIISNKDNIAYGGQSIVKSFHTSPYKTTVRTIGTSGVTSTAATLKGSFSSIQEITTYFQYKKVATDGAVIEWSDKLCETTNIIEGGSGSWTSATGSGSWTNGTKVGSTGAGIWEMTASSTLNTNNGTWRSSNGGLSGSWRTGDDSGTWTATTGMGGVGTATWIGTGKTNVAGNISCALAPPVVDCPPNQFWSVQVKACVDRTLSTPNIKLEPYTKYQFRAVGVASVGIETKTVYGATLNFTTSPLSTISLGENPFCEIPYIIYTEESGNKICVLSPGSCYPQAFNAGPPPSCVDPATLCVAPQVYSFPNNACITPVTITLSASPTFLSSGDSSIISWLPVNATNCTGTDGGSTGWAGYKSTTPGNSNTGPLTNTTTFGITCTNDTDSVSKSVRVTISGQVTPNYCATHPTELWCRDGSGWDPTPPDQYCIAHPTDPWCSPNHGWDPTGGNGVWTWTGTVWSGGTWTGGTWNNGTWTGGTWSGEWGTFTGGTWSNGAWTDGTWTNTLTSTTGTWSSNDGGQSGTWSTGTGAGTWIATTGMGGTGITTWIDNGNGAGTWASATGSGTWTRISGTGTGTGTGGTWKSSIPNTTGNPNNGTWGSSNGGLSGTWGTGTGSGTWVATSGTGGTGVTTWICLANGKGTWKSTTGSGTWDNGKGKCDGNSGTWTNLSLGQAIKPPNDAIVRYHEGIETVFIRQILANPIYLNTFNRSGANNSINFVWDLAHKFAKMFSYVDDSGREIRVSLPDIAAYQLQLIGEELTVYEYYDDKIIDIRNVTTVFKDKAGYEYYFER